MAIVSAFFRDESGQSMTEYALILALVALAAVFALGQIADPIAALFKRTVDALDVNVGN